MTEELTRAAADAGEALGMSVEVPWARGAHYDVQVWTPMDDEDGGQPLVDSRTNTEAEALAYCRGLETGARIQRERHAEVVSAVHAMFSDMDAGYSPARGDCAVDRLAKALSELEG